MYWAEAVWCKVHLKYVPRQRWWRQQLIFPIIYLNELAASPAGSFIVHVPIFFWVGYRWDGHYGWIPPVAIPNPDQPTIVNFWHIITSVPRWKVRNNIEFLFKDVFKNYVLNHFLYWKERESCRSTDATSVHIDPTIFAMGFYPHPKSRMCCQKNCLRSIFFILVLHR